MSEDKNKNSELVAAGVFQRRESGEQELADDIVVPDPNAPLKESDVAIVAGDDDTMRRLTRDAERGRPHP